MIELDVSVKKFEGRNGDVASHYAYSTKLYDITDTAEQNGTWYKVFFTKELKQQLKEKNVKINRPFKIQIEPECVVYNKDEKKIFFLADKPCFITFKSSGEKQSKEHTVPKFDEAFRTAKVEVRQEQPEEAEKKVEDIPF